MLILSDFNINDYKNGKLIIYGAAIWGRMALSVLLRGIIKIDRNDIIICDANFAGEKIAEGFEIVCPEDIIPYKDSPVLVCGTRGFEGICDFLSEQGATNAYYIESLLDSVNYDDFSDCWDVLEPSSMKRRYMYFVKKYNRQFSESYFEIEQLGIVLTQKCSLKCAKCVNYMPYLPNPREFDVDCIIDSLIKISNSVDGIIKVSLVGGEVFLHKALYQVVDWCCECDKITEVEVLTNATIIPKGKNLDCLKQQKVRVVLDDYGTLSTKLSELKELFQSNGIAHYVMFTPYWYDYNKKAKKSYSESELIEKYSKCNNSKCYDLLGDVLVNCHRSYSLFLCGEYEKQNTDALISLKSFTNRGKELRHQIFDLIYNRKYIEACRHCAGINPGKNIPVAEQMH